MSELHVCISVIDNRDFILAGQTLRRALHHAPVAHRIAQRATQGMGPLPQMRCNSAAAPNVWLDSAVLHSSSVAVLDNAAIELTAISINSFCFLAGLNHDGH